MSTGYYQKNKEKFCKKAHERYQNLSNLFFQEIFASTDIIFISGVGLSPRQ